VNLYNDCPLCGNELLKHDLCSEIYFSCNSCNKYRCVFYIDDNDGYFALTKEIINIRTKNIANIKRFIYNTNFDIWSSFTYYNGITLNKVIEIDQIESTLEKILILM